MNNKYEVRKLIKEFEKLDCKIESIQSLEDNFFKVLSKYSHTFARPQLEKGLTVHRVRINNEDKLFDNLSDLWSPPKEKIKKLGRCNEIGSPILYVSCGGHTSLNEVGVKDGDVITCLECITNDYLNVVDLGALKKMKRIESFNKFLEIRERILFQRLNNKELKQINILIENFIVKEFTKKIDDDKSYLYKKSVAISNFFLKAPGVEGLIYPSIKSDLKEMNIAIPIDVANRILKPVRIDVLEAKKIDHRFGYKYLFGCYDNINFNRKLEYGEPKFIEHWMTRELYNP